MAHQWIDGVKNTHQLNYYLDSIAGSWLTAIREAIREFNALSANHSLGVTYSQSDSPPSANGGADINIATGSGNVSFTYAGTHSTTLSGNLVGRTVHVRQQAGQIVKAFMFLPAQPLSSAASGRPAGPGVLKVIALHELIHGCGLSDSDHTPDDVFIGSPNIMVGRTAAQDRIEILSGGQYRTMPPIIFSSTTAGKISRIWNE